MDYKQLQFFLAVCEAQSFRNAAVRCYVSQQAISKSLSNLEQELGVQNYSCGIKTACPLPKPVSSLKNWHGRI